MFDEIQRALKRLEGSAEISVKIHVDDQGYLDRQCPASECGAGFKVQLDDWKQKVKNEAAFCPTCRHEARATEWNTQAQKEYLDNAGVAHVLGVIDEALQSDAQRFNARQPRGGLVNLSMSYHPGRKPILIPPDAAAIMQQESTCEECACRYASVGAAFFCPACGHNSVRSTFTSSIQTVRIQVENVKSIRQAVTTAAGEDAGTDTARQILENGLVKLVSAFQRYAEATFRTLASATTIKVRKNAFQNLDESNELWRKATGTGYDDLLSPGETVELRTFFQQRHLLAHREGIVDHEYIEKSGDRSYDVGQKLVIRETMVRRLADLVEQLSKRLPQGQQSGAA